ALFAKQLVAAVAVVSDGRCSDKSARHSRSATRVSGGCGEGSRAENTAVANFALELLCPKAEDVFPREMHDRVDAVEFLRIERLYRVPLEFVPSGRRSQVSARHKGANLGHPANQRKGRVTPSVQRRTNCATQQTRCAADQDVHGMILALGFR